MERKGRLHRTELKRSPPDGQPIYSSDLASLFHCPWGRGAEDSCPGCYLEGRAHDKMTEAEYRDSCGREPARTQPALQQRWTGTSLCSALGTRTGHTHPAGQAEGRGRRKHNPQGLGLALLGLVHSPTWDSWAVTSTFSRIALSDHEHHMTETENYKQYLLPISQHKNLCRWVTKY